MALIHQNSCLCVKSELDLFDLPPTQNSIESGSWVEYHPLAPLSDGGNIEYVIPGTSGDEYIDLPHCYWYVQAKINFPEPLVANPDVPYEVGPVNIWPHAMISQITIKWNGKTVTSSNFAHPYSAMFEISNGYDIPAKKSHLSMGLWYPDTPGQHDALSNANEGYKQRAKIAERQKVVEMITSLHVDVMNQQKYLLNGVEMRFTFVRSKDAFHLMGAQNCNATTTILSAKLMVRKAKINPTILLAHAKALETTTAKYPYTRVDVKTATINAGLRNKVMDSLYLGQLPKRIILGFVDNARFNGDFRYNPFKFDHFDLTFLSLYVDGVQVPAQPLTADFTNQNAPETLKAYHTLFTGTGLHAKDEGNGINRFDYTQGNTLYAFDLTPDLSSHTGHWNLQRTGCLRLEVRFKVDLPTAINLVMYSEFDSVIEIDKHRHVSCDFSS